MRKLRIFRMVGTERVPFILELDETLTVVNETPEQAAFDVAVYGQSPAEVKDRMTRWSTIEIEENPLPGTEELRAKYRAEREALIESHKKNKTMCPPCEIGKMVRHYRMLLEKDGYL